MVIKKKVLLSTFLIVVVGCSSYKEDSVKLKNKIRSGQIEDSISELEKFSAVEGNDQLIYLLDYASVLQIKKNYKESTNQFLKAEKLMELNDYFSVSRAAGAALTNESALQYKPDSFEYFLVNAFIAFNFINTQSYDSAMVEVRKINEKISKMKVEGRDPYEQNSFALYLSAILWESDKKYDDAYIAYEASFKRDPANPYIKEDLVRSSYLARRPDQHLKWKKEFGLSYKPEASESEIVIIAALGWGPEKVPSQNSYRLPQLIPTFSSTAKVRLKIDESTVEDSILVYNLEQDAIQTLNKDYSALVARKAGSLAVKAIAADQIRQKNEGLGHLAWIALNLLDKADLRQWSTLPKNFQLIRKKIKPGSYKLKVEGLSHYNQYTGEADFIGDVIVSSRKKNIYMVRFIK